MRIVGGYQDTRTNNEDFAITPYLFSVITKGSFQNGKIYGLGICCGYFAVYIGLGFNLPETFKSFKNTPSKK